MIGLEYLCKLNRISYSELADKLGISRQTVNAWTSGRRNVSEKHYDKLKSIFKVSEDWFNKEINDTNELKLQRLVLKNNLIQEEVVELIQNNKGQWEEVTRLHTDNNQYEHMEVLDFEIRIKEVVNDIYNSIMDKFNDAANKSYDVHDGFSKGDQMATLFILLLDIVKKKNIRLETLRNTLYAINGDIDNEFRSKINKLILNEENRLNQEMYKKEEENKELLEIEDLL